MTSLSLFTDTATKPDAFTVAGVAVRQDAQGRFCLNDLHKAAGGENRHRPSLWADNQQAKDLIAEINLEAGIPALESVHGGASQGTYVCKELVYAYAMWVSASFHLKVIRAYDSMVQAKAGTLVATAFSAPATPLGQDLEALQILANWLNVAPSGQIGMARVALQHHAPHLLPALPGYAVDAPKVQGMATTGSSEPAFSVSHLLKEHGITIAAAKFNSILQDAGLLEKRTRKSTSAASGSKSFWVITDKGLAFGKNAVSDKSPRETQPLWYESTFERLLKVVRDAY